MSDQNSILSEHCCACYDILSGHFKNLILATGSLDSTINLWCKLLNLRTYIPPLYTYILQSNLSCLKYTGKIIGYDYNWIRYNSSQKLMSYHTQYQNGLYTYCSFMYVNSVTYSTYIPSITYLMSITMLIRSYNSPAGRGEDKPCPGQSIATTYKSE